MLSVNPVSRYLLMLVLCLTIVGMSISTARAADGNEGTPFEAPPPEGAPTYGYDKVPDPGSNLWREVRDRKGVLYTADTQVKGMDSNVLINSNGEKWRRFRMEELVPTVGIVLASVLGLIILFHLIKGGLKIEGGRSGKFLLRFREVDRVLHWAVAIIFVFLAISGLILLGGRSLLIPVIGKDAFSVLASACKEGHNLFGPLFLVGVIGLFIRFVSKNFLGKGDIGWIFKAGGMLGGKHPTAGFFNMGEKMWFWLVILVGLVVSATGLALEFSFFGGTRELMELALVLHGVGATLLIVGSFGHIYMGVAGMQGSLESMTSGYVDLNWARQHHDQWAEECEKKGEVLDKKPGTAMESNIESTPDNPVTTQ
jgi:formate dehydrogenase subunit gamma